MCFFWDLSFFRHFHGSLRSPTPTAASSAAASRTPPGAPRTSWPRASGSASTSGRPKWSLPGRGTTRRELRQVARRPGVPRPKRRRCHWCHPPALSNCPEPPGHGREIGGSFWGAPSKGWSLMATVLILACWNPSLSAGFPLYHSAFDGSSRFPANHFFSSRQTGISDFEGAHLRSFECLSKHVRLSPKQQPQAFS